MRRIDAPIKIPVADDDHAMTMKGSRYDVGGTVEGCSKCLVLLSARRT